MNHPTPSPRPTRRTLTPSNQATAYGVRINPAAISNEPLAWRIISAHHLSPDENRGNHHIYIDALDEAGQPNGNPALRIGWTWDGRRDDEHADPKPLDKTDGGAMGNVDLYQGQVTTVWIEGDDLPSERAENLHTDHDVLEKTSDGQDGNTRFHHSFHIVFQRVRNPEPAPVTVTAPGTPAIMPMVAATNGQTPAAPAALGRGVVSGVELNLRRAPDKNSERITSLFRDDAVDIFEQLGDWLRVRSLAAATGGQEGYVFGEYVQWAGSLPSAPATPAPQNRQNALSTYRDLITEQAQRLGLDPAMAMAIVATESPGGAPFGADGRMIIRFENHIFWERWGARNPGQFAQYFQMNEGKRWDGDGHFWRPSPDAAWQGFHGRQEREWQVFEFARRLDETAAMLSISMGAPQIMGFNHTRLQYDTVQKMFHAFASDARNQIEGLFDFIQASGALTPLLQGDYVGFAHIYNGPGQAADYAAIIQRNLAQFQQPRGAAARGLEPVDTEAKPRMAAPASPVPGKPLIEADPKLYEAWSNHIKQGFENSQTMFSRVLQAFMDPYWMTVRMYRLLFAVGIGAFVFSGLLALIGTLYKDANTTAALGGSILFGGLGVVAFLTYFVNRSLQALEENLQFITWLGVIYNSYWTRLAYQQNLDTVQADVEDITNDAISQINALLDKHTLLSGKRPNLPEGEKK